MGAVVDVNEVGMVCLTDALPRFVLHVGVRFQFTDALCKWLAGRVRNKVQVRPLAARRREEIRTHPIATQAAKVESLTEWHSNTRHDCA